MTERAEQFVRTWWPVILLAIGIASAWGASTKQISMIATGQETMAAGQQAIIMKIDHLAEGLAGTQATVDYHTRDIAELRNQLTAIQAPHR